MARASQRPHRAVRVVVRRRSPRGRPRTRWTRARWLLRFHGVLAPRHRWRDRVVPRPPARAPVCKGKPSELGPAETTLAATPARPSSRALEAGDGRAALVLPAPTATLTTTGAAVQVAPNVLSIAHWDRILEGELYASSSRLDWRTLLKRTFDIDLRVCVRCGGRLTVRTMVTAPASAAKMLAARRRPRAAARAPHPRPPDPRRQTARHVAPCRSRASRTPQSPALPAPLEIRPPTDTTRAKLPGLLRRYALTGTILFEEIHLHARVEVEATVTAGLHRAEDRCRGTSR